MCRLHSRLNLTLSNVSVMYLLPPTVQMRHREQEELVQCYSRQERSRDVLT